MERVFQTARFRFASIPAAFAVTAAATLWGLPAPHGRIHYLLAGALATAVSLGAAWVLIALRGRTAVRRARAVRRAEPQEPS